MKDIRNFSIIAHIDHGKSTLADRILELTGAVDPAKMRAQVLDSMELERERGITIKAQAVRVVYTAADGQSYRLHLIDTPGHVDFSYEVSRSLAACEGALLVVDAAQGVEAQTVANTYAAIEAGLELIPVVNKVDLPSAEPDEVAAQIVDLIGGDPDDVIRISAKTGEGVGEVLDAIVDRVPPPDGEPDAPGRALIFDSEFDQYRGVVAYVRVVDGEFASREPIAAMQAGTEAEIDEIGHLTPEMRPAESMAAGEVGYVITGIKDVARLRVGDTLTPRARPASEPLPGYREVRPVVFCGLFPIDTDQYEDLRDALERLALNDAALSYEPESSEALGFGFRCGFLGLLHMDIVRERLEREYDLELLATTPNVRYEVRVRGGETVEVHSPAEMPDPGEIEEILEPYIRATIVTPTEYVGAVMELCQGRRGTHVDMHYLSPAARPALLRAPAGRDRARLLRSAQVADARIRVARLRADRDARLRPRQARRAPRRRPRRRAVDNRPPRQGVRGRQGARRAAPEDDPATALRRPGPGGDRLAGARARDGQGAAQGRDREAVRRRRDPEAQAAREAEGGEAADEAGRPRRGAPGGVPVGPGAG